jgi:shikimate dehydrogenase
VKVFGIIGRPLGHSRSKAWFDERFAAAGLADCRFENFELPSLDALDGVLERWDDELRGFCVTSPYKVEIMERLDEISPEARAIGAVNCVRVDDGKGCNGGRRLVGFNTDAYGFGVGLEKLIGNARPQSLVLGTGGASRAVRHALENAGIEYRLVSRTPGPGLLTYGELTPEIVERHHLIVNTTPLGTHPDTAGKPPIPYDAIGTEHMLYDLVYNPPLTSFLAEGARRGAKTMGGTAMLHAQAEKNLDIWNLFNS